MPDGDETVEVEAEDGSKVRLSRRQLIAAVGATGASAVGLSESQTEPQQSLDSGVADLTDNFNARLYAGPSNIQPSGASTGDLWKQTDTGKLLVNDSGTWSGPLPVSTEQAAIGDSEFVSAGPVGDKGEFRLLTTVALTGQFSTTSTSYIDVMSPTSGLLVPLPDMDQQTNLGDLHVSLTCELWNDTPSTETTYARIAGIWEDDDLSSTEVTMSDGPSRVTSSKVPVDSSAPESYTIEMRVTGGEGFIKRAGVNVWGVVE